LKYQEVAVILLKMALYNFLVNFAAISAVYAGFLLYCMAVRDGNGA